MIDELRDYQSEAVDSVWKGFSRGNVLVEAPTGSGKSHIIAGLIDKALNEFPDTRILMLVHRKELIVQNAEKLAKYGHHAEMYCASLKKKGIGAITFASIQSLARIKDMPKFDFIIVDECHRIPTRNFGQYRKVIEKVDAPCVGFTATPYRLQGGLIYGKDKLFPRLNYRISVSVLLKRGFLCPIVAFRGQGEADLSDIKKGSNGDFAVGQLQDAYTDELLVPEAVDNLLTLCNKSGRKSIIVFAAGIRHAQMIRDEMVKYGESPRIITGETVSETRTETISLFRRGKVRVLINVGVFTEGFDAPNVDCVALMRATLSPGLYIQMVGRGMRIFPGKDDCLLLDYGGNVLRHGPIDNVQPPNNAREKAPPLTRVCPMCEMLVPIRKKQCPGCGFEFPPSEIDTQAKHTKFASGADPLDPKKLEVWKVGDIRYKIHKKAGRPDSVMVTYHKGGSGALGALRSSTKINEFVCPEHRGQATTRARQWLLRRGVSPDRGKTAEDIVGLMSAGLGMEPKEIVVNTVGKWPDIVDIRF